MKDNTAAARMERGMAQLQVHLTNLQTLLGRLEALIGSLSPGGANTPLSPDSQPPVTDGEAEALAEKVIKRQLEEMKESAGA